MWINVSRILLAAMQLCQTEYWSSFPEHDAPKIKTERWKYEQNNVATNCWVGGRILSHGPRRDPSRWPGRWAWLLAQIHP